MNAEEEGRGAEDSNSKQDGSLWGHSRHVGKLERSLHSVSYTRPGVIPRLYQFYMASPSYVYVLGLTLYRMCLGEHYVPS